MSGFARNASIDVDQQGFVGPKSATERSLIARVV